MVSLSPEGAERGVQMQGAHHAPKAGTQRPQKHAACNTVQEFSGGGGMALSAYVSAFPHNVSDGA